ncbi:MAG: osmotically inducible protein C [Rhodobacterales bacterium]|nr:MAG: osmotically inducible protein C [Rhodobacterales bacterium]
MATETFTFPGTDGSALAGRLDLPEGKPLATALFAHCFTCTKDSHAARRISGRLTRAGIAVLRFDFTGLGHSGGDFAETGFASNVGDIIAAARALEARGMAPALLIGHSLGGTAMLRARAGIASARAVVTLGAPFAPDHVSRNFACRVEELERNGRCRVELGGRPFEIGRAFFDDIRETDLTAAIHGLKAALLVMHAPFDQVVGIRNATDIFVAAQHPKSFVTLDDADHLITGKADAAYAADVIATWAARYLGIGFDVTPAGAEAMGAMPAPAEPAPAGVVRVVEADPARPYTNRVTNGADHAWLADEPASVNGANLGPNPYAMLKAALGACTSMTIRMYANVKKWPVTGISVDVTHEKVAAADGRRDDRGRPVKIDSFTRAIRIEGDLTPDQHVRIAEIADRCPVHKTLHQGAKIVTRLADG